MYQAARHGCADFGMPSPYEQAGAFRRGLRLVGGNPNAPLHKNWRAALYVCLHCLERTALVYPVMWRHLAASEPCPKCGGWLARESSE